MESIASEIENIDSNQASIANSKRLRTSSIPAELLLAGCIVYRVIIALVLCTTFVPDEYYQGGEQAFWLSQHIGQPTWEWSPSIRIRSYIPNLITLGIFRVLMILEIDTGLFLSVVPRIMQAILSGYADYCLFSILKHIHSEKAAKWGLLIHATSWSSVYLMSRNLINSFEAAVILIGACWCLQLGIPATTPEAMTVWMLLVRILSCDLPRIKMMDSSQKKPWSNLKVWVVVSILAVVCSWARPTSIWFWVGLVGLFLIAHCHNYWKSALYILQLQIIPASCLGFVSCAIIDSFIYDAVTIVPFNFVEVNVFQRMALLFGSSSWHWYFSQGLLALIGIYTPALVYSLVFIPVPFYVGFLTILAIGFPVWLTAATKHKEIRFLLPTMMIINMFLGSSMVNFSKSKQGDRKPPSKRTRIQSLILVTCALNVIVGIGLCIAHQSGTERGAIFISKHSAKKFSDAAIKSHGIAFGHKMNVFSLAPCHAFPGPSYFYPGSRIFRQSLRGLRLGFSSSEPSCSPILYNNTVSPSRLFEESPAEYWRKAYVESHAGRVLQNGSPMSIIDINLPDTMRGAENHCPANFIYKSIGDFESGPSAVVLEAIHILEYVITFDAYVDALDSALGDFGFVEVTRFRHTYFRYDYDDPLVKYFVVVFVHEYFCVSP